MSSTPSRTDETNDRPVERPEPDDPVGRYAHLSLEDGSTIIYDPEESESWLQSDYVVDLGD